VCIVLSTIKSRFGDKVQLILLYNAINSDTDIVCTALGSILSIVLNDFREPHKRLAEIGHLRLRFDLFDSCARYKFSSFIHSLYCHYARRQSL